MGGRMRLDHGGLMITDPDRSRAFYVGVLGLREVPRPPTFDFPGFWVQVGDQELHLIGEAEPGRTSEVHPGYTRTEVETGYASHVAIVVDDLEMTVAGVRERGGEIIGGPRARGDGVLQAYLTDPDGHVVELMQVGVPVTGDEPRITTPGG
jgi:catechol 2,3-dioxygenase-like lactoylglutathione lyase family enzyme